MMEQTGWHIKNKHMTQLQPIEKTEEMKAIEIANKLLDEAEVTAQHLCSQLNQIGQMIFAQTEVQPQLIFDLLNGRGLKLIQLLGGAKQLLALYDAEKFFVVPAPVNFVPTETKVVLTPKE